MLWLLTSHSSCPCGFVGCTSAVHIRDIRALSSTARNFLAAATFLGLIRLFPPVSNEEAGNEAEGDSDIGEKIKYAKWKAADINKALRQGRRPDPGPPGWDPEAERQAREEAQRVLKESQAAEFEEEAHINQATTDIDPAEEAELAREMQKLMEDPSDAPGGTAPLSTAPSSKEEGAEPPEVISTSQEVSVFPTVPQDQGPYDEHARTDIVSDINPEREKDEKLETVDAVRKQRPPLPQPPRSSGEEPAPPATVVEPPSSPGPSPTPGLSAAMPLKRTASHTSRPLPSPPGPSAPPHDADARGLFPALSAPTAPSAPSASPSAPTSSVFPLASPSAPTPPNVPPPPVTNPPTVGLPTPTSNGRAPPLTGMAQAPPSTLPTSLSPQKTAQVQKLAKYAASALDFDDLDTARQELTRALSILNGQA